MTITPPRTRPTVWVVDDSPLETEVMQRVLGREYDVGVFRDGSTLLEKLSEGANPHLVVLDNRLEGATGIEITSVIRQTRDEATLPILLVTAWGESSTVVEALRAGANDYLNKPFRPEELLARVGTLVRTRLLHAELQASQAQLQRRMEFEQYLIGIVSHDLRSPLAAVTLNAQALLKRPNLDEAAQRMAQRIQDAAGRPTTWFGTCWTSPAPGSPIGSRSPWAPSTSRSCCSSWRPTSSRRG